MMMAVANSTPKPMLAAIDTGNCACRLRSMMSGNTPRNVVGKPLGEWVVTRGGARGHPIHRDNMES